MRAPYRNRFDPSGDFEARKRVTVGGYSFEPGELFDKTLVSERRLRQLFAQRTIVYVGEKPGAKLSPEEAAKDARAQRRARAEKIRPHTAKTRVTAPKGKGKGRAAAQRQAAKKPPRETVTGEDAIRIARAGVRIPKNWRELKWTDRLKLAAQLSDTPVKNGADVERAITEELERRGNP